jgi:hypothetical protein
MQLWEKMLLVVAGVVAVFALIALWSYGVLLGLVFLIGCASWGVVWSCITLYDKWLQVLERHNLVLERQPRPASLSPRVSAIPTFKELLDTGRIGESKPVIIAWDKTGQAISLPKVSTLGISGVRGSGKTITTLLLILSYIVATGGAIRFIITDPHMYGDTGESLAELISLLSPFFLTLEDVRTSIQPDDKKYLSLLTRIGHSFLPNPNQGGGDLLGWSQIMDMELDRRKQGKKGAPWMLVIDEFSAVMDDKAAMKQLSSVLKKTNQEARKFGIDALLIGQDWRADSVGGTSVRNTIPNFVSHNMPGQWSKLILPGREAKETPYLRNGEIVFQTTGQITRGMVSLAEESDILHVLRTYLPKQPMQIEEVFNAPTLTLGPGLVGNGSYVDPQQQTDRLVPVPLLLAQDTKSPDILTCPWPEEEVVAIRDAYAKGMSETEIAKLVYDVNGKDIPTGRAKVREVIQWMMIQAIHERDLSP